MSLINQMLKDLEGRKKPPVDIGIPISAQTLTRSSNKKKYSIIVLITLMISLFFCFFYFKHFFVPQSKQALVSNGATEQQQVNTLQIKKIADISVGHLPEEMVSLTGIALQMQQNITHLRFLLNQKVFYEVNTDEKEQKVSIILSQTEIAADLPPVNYANSAIKNIDISPINNKDIKIVLTLNDGAEIKSLGLSEGNRYPELQIDFLYDVTEHPESQVGLIKRPVAQFNAQEEYQQALNFMDVRQDGKAITLLSKIIEQFPDFLPARESLAALLLDHGDKSAARRVIEIGLRQQPFYPALIKLKAQLLVSEGKSEQALNLLQKAAPPLDTDPDYHALIAGLYQQEGQSILAAQLYKQLVAIQPMNAVWWMGLGVSLESAGRRSEAMQAYMQADNTDGLSPELKAFVEGRLGEA